MLLNLWPPAEAPLAGLEEGTLNWWNDAATHAFAGRFDRTRTALTQLRGEVLDNPELTAAIDLELARLPRDPGAWQAHLKDLQELIRRPQREEGRTDAIVRAVAFSELKLFQFQRRLSFDADRTRLHRLAVVAG
jgi:hypothetical protein